MTRIQTLYNITFDVENNAPLEDAGGALIPNTTPVSAGNKGKIDMLSGNKILLNERKDVIATYILFCDNITITDADIIISNSETYDVIRVDDTTLQGSNPHLEVYLMKQD